MREAFEVSQKTFLSRQENPNLIHPSAEAINLARFAGGGGDERRSALKGLALDALQAIAANSEAVFSRGFAVTVWRLAQAAENALPALEEVPNPRGLDRESTEPLSGATTKKIVGILKERFSPKIAKNPGVQLTTEQRLGNFAALQARVLES